MKVAHNVAILGFGVVGGGVANLITQNQSELQSYLGKEIKIKRILDLRDFPDSPFANLVTHDFADILKDEEIDTVIEVMGGSHPAYEFTVSALNAGKNVITSNKEVVANFGDEFLKLAKENNVNYRFEAAVGGGIPVITPLLTSVRQNKIKEVRGILNGTTNYILTKMFTFGDSFESALKDAQEKGYAERNPDADILGTDAARKIAILSALVTDKLCSVDGIHTEGITAIRSQDVAAVESIDHKIKLLGRCITDGEGKAQVCVAPFLIPSDSPLANVNGVYNAVEVVAEPLGNVMFYGQGAGAGATASAVVSDLLPIISNGAHDPLSAAFAKADEPATLAFGELETRSYVSVPKGSDDKVKTIFTDAEFLPVESECAFITSKMKEDCVTEKLSRLNVEILSRIRFL